MTARGVAERVRRGDVSVVEVVGEALDRAARDPHNAFVLVDADGALRRAEDLDRRIAAGEDPGPLAGVPIALKDLVDQAGLPNTRGSSFPPEVPTRSATVVERLEAAGAVIVGRAGLHEFAFGFTSENEWFGPVRNPLDPALSPGGSSGGSAAAVAAGVVPVGIGTDTGGSVRVPAALCGLVGVKPTHGLVPLTGVFPLAPSLDTVGPITRDVADAALVLAVIAGDDPSDPWSVPGAGFAPPPAEILSGIRIGRLVSWDEAPATRAVRAAVDAALAAAVDAGATVVDVDEPRLVPDADARVGAYVEVAAIHRERYARAPERYGPSVAARIEEALATPADALVGALRWRAGARHALVRLGESVDVLAVPTVGATRKPIGVTEIDVDGIPMFHRTVLASFTAPINGMGAPAIALPLPGSEVPPPSLQLVAPPRSEGRLLQVAAALEEAGIVGTNASRSAPG